MVAKWRQREIVDDASMGPKERRSSVLGKEEALVVTFRRHGLLPSITASARSSRAFRI